MRPDSAILDVSGRIKLCQVCESGFQFQFFQSSGNLFISTCQVQESDAAYIKVLSKLDVSLSSKVDFSQDRISSLVRRLVTHVLHGVDQVRTGDSLIVILLISSMPIRGSLVTHKVHLLELCSQASNLFRSKLSSRVQSSLIRLETKESLCSLVLPDLAPLQIGSLSISSCLSRLEVTYLWQTHRSQEVDSLVKLGLFSRSIPSKLFSHDIDNSG